MDDHPLDVFDSRIPNISVNLPSQRETDSSRIAMLVAFLLGHLPPGDLEMEFLCPDQISYWAIQRAGCMTSQIQPKCPCPLSSSDSGPCSLIPMLPQGPQPYLPLHRPGSLNQEPPSLPHHIKGSVTSAFGFLGSAHRGSACHQQGEWM